MTEKQTFEGLGIKPEILKVLDGLNFTTPTPIQNQAIPVAIKESDVIGIAQTGTGKTLAFGIPTIQKLIASRGMALIILPTRELALQVDESISKIARNFNLRSVVLIGGQNMSKQLRDLKANPRIIISTPGRLIDHLERKTISLEKVEILVLDEADRMLDMGFEPQIKRILQEVPAQRQTMLFSATMPAEIVSIANRYMKTPLRVEVAPAGSATENVTHEIFFVKDGSKLALLETILKERSGSTLVFSRTKHGAKRIALALRQMGFTSTEIHSNRTLSQRMNALEGFKKGKYQIMVATDIAARGIDVKGIELVINYDLPDSPEDYVHRIGRTGRAENLGHAISFATPRQAYDIRIIERLIKKVLPVSPLPELVKSEASAAIPQESRGRAASGSRYGNRPQDRDRRKSEGQGSRENSRRGFLPKRSSGNRNDEKRSSPAQKGREFYRDFDTANFFEKLDKEGGQDSNKPIRKTGNNFRKPGKGYSPNFRSGKDMNRPSSNARRNSDSQRDEAGEPFQREPFMNIEKDPAYRKPFGSYKPSSPRKNSPRKPFRKTAPAGR